MAEEKEDIVYFKNQIRVPIENKDFVENNPEGLTLEGAKFNVYQWKTKSRNKYVAAKYDLMVYTCKNFTKSGKLADGKTILSRDEEGNVTWSEMIDDKFNLVPKLEKVIEVKQ